MSIIRVPWTVQPQTTVRVDWGNPLANGLVHLTLGTNDAVASSIGTRGSNVTTGPGYFSVNSTNGLSLGPISQSIATTTKWTQFAFVRPSSLSARRAPSLLSGTNYRLGMAMGYGTSSKILGYSSGTGTSYLDEAYTGFWVANQWIKAALTFDSVTNTSNAYKDGALMGAMSVIGGADPTIDGNLTIGSAGATADMFGWVGDVQMVAFWSRVLTKSEIASLAANPWQLFAPLPRRIWVPVSAPAATASVGPVKSVPWTRQPPNPLGPDRSNPLTKDLVLLQAPGFYTLGNTVVGTKVAVESPGVARGFGATYGVGPTDSIETTLTRSNTLRTYLVWAQRNGLGGATLGRYIDKSKAIAVDDLLFDNSGSGTRYSRGFSTTAGQWQIPSTPVDVDTVICFTYDASSTANVASGYLNGIPQLTTTEVAPVGTPQSSTDPFIIGNRKSDNARNFDGLIYLVAIWDRILSPAEVKKVSQNPWQLFAPLPRRIWAPSALPPPDVPANAPPFRPVPWVTQPQVATRAAKTGLANALSFLWTASSGRYESVTGRLATTDATKKIATPFGLAADCLSTATNIVFPGEYITTSDGLGNGDFTIVVIAKLTSSGSGETVFAQDGGTGNPFVRFANNTAADNTATPNSVALVTYNGSAVSGVAVAGAADGEYHVWTLTRSGANLYIDKDGIQLATAAPSKRDILNPAFPANVGIGNYGSVATPRFNGDVVVVAAWDRALSNAERVRLGLNFENIWALYSPQTRRVWNQIASTAITGQTNESFALADVQDVTATFQASRAESFALADSQDATVISVSTGSTVESFALADSQSATAAFVASEAESFALADNQTVTAAFVAAQAESLALADSQDATVVSGSVSTTQESFALADTQTVVGIFLNNITETIGFADSQDASTTLQVGRTESFALADSQDATITGPVTYPVNVNEQFALQDSQSATGGIAAGTDSYWNGLRYSPDGALYVTYTKTANDIFIAGKRISPSGQLVLDAATGPYSMFQAGHMFAPTDYTLAAVIDAVPPATATFINGLLEGPTLGAYLTTVAPS